MKLYATHDAEVQVMSHKTSPTSHLYLYTRARLSLLEPVLRPTVGFSPQPYQLHGSSSSIC